jgi:hypothetical protein
MSFIKGKSVNDEGWRPTMKQFLRQNGDELVLSLAPSATQNPCRPLNLQPELCIPGKLRPESVDPESPKIVVVASGEPATGFEFQLKPESVIVQNFVTLTHVLAERSACGLSRPRSGRRAPTTLSFAFDFSFLLQD